MLHNHSILYLFELSNFNVVLFQKVIVPTECILYNYNDTKYPKPRKLFECEALPVTVGDINVMICISCFIQAVFSTNNYTLPANMNVNSNSNIIQKRT